MKKIEKKMMAAICCAGLLAVGAAGAAMAQSPVILAGSGQTGNQAEKTSGEEETLGAEKTSGEEETLGAEKTSGEEETSGAEETAGAEKIEASVDDAIRIWGAVLGVEDGTIRIDNQSGASFEGEIVLNISDEYSKVLDAENGFPAALTDIQEGEVIYAYIGPAMTMSLPPITNAEMVICGIPEDYKAPDYVRVKEMKEQQDGSFALTASDGAAYQIPADCMIIPYLTRNMVRLSDVAEGSRCLIWSDDSGIGQKIVLFAE